MRDKIRTIDELKKIRAQYKEEGYLVATTNGSFDLLHIGHMYMLESARRLTDELVVLINSDNSISRLKGPRRPIVPERERAEMLSALEYVSHICIFDDDNPLSYITELKPDIHIKGATFEERRVSEERKLVESWGGKHITLPLVEGYSTTNLIERILRAHDSGDLNHTNK